MQHQIKHYTDADLAAAIASPTVSDDVKSLLSREISERGWAIVDRAWSDDSSECAGCEYYLHEVYSDTGHEYNCLLIDGSVAPTCPQDCAAYDRIHGAME
jgi:hypothetical protein